MHRTLQIMTVCVLCSNKDHCWWLTIQASANSGNKSHWQEATVTDLSLGSLVQTQASYFCPEREIFVLNCALKLHFKPSARHMAARHYCHKYNSGDPAQHFGILQSFWGSDTQHCASQVINQLNLI